MLRWGGLVVLGAEVRQDLFAVNCCCHGQLFCLSTRRAPFYRSFSTHAIPERSSRVLRFGFAVYILAYSDSNYLNRGRQRFSIQLIVKFAFQRLTVLQFKRRVTIELET